MPARSETLRLASDERTLQTVIQRQAQVLGSCPCLEIGETKLTYAEVAETAARFGGSLRCAGVQAGDRVAIVSENRFELLAAWLGCVWLGSILVPLNPASKGAQLAHLVTESGPRVLAIESTLAERLRSLGEAPPELERIWLIGGEAGNGWGALPVEPFPASGEPIEPAPVGPADMLAILYTSGTTGPPKGVVCSHAQFTWWGENVGGRWLGVTGDDVLYTCLPLHHTNALNAFVHALMHGACFVAGPRFSASRFWPRIAGAEATVTYLLGTMVSILCARDPSPAERAHRLRIVLAPGTPADLWDVFRARFGVEIVEGHGMTETNGVIGPRDGEQRPGCMGRAMPGFEACVVDEREVEVEDGVAGELVVRADEPLAFATGYWRNDDAAAAAWRNRWFHSGDRVVRERDGYFRFLDRTKDAIRRRGENISAWEVEQAVLEHPNVAAAAAVPVASALGEDDVLVCVVPRAGATLDPVDLVRFCEPRLAYYAIPRYVDLLDELPLTESGKVRKYVLRERGLTATAWDREAAGIELQR
jgi:crotonobetaine/carnitine-CoA ligase